MNLSKTNTDIVSIIGDYVGFAIFIAQGVILILLVLYFFIPSYTTIMALRGDIDAKDDELLSLSNYANYLQELANSSLAVEEEIIDYALPSENDVVTLILTYEGLAKTEGLTDVSPISLSPGVLRKEKSDIAEGLSGVQEVPFSMEISAEDEEAATTIIDEIGNTQRIFDIVNLTWTVPLSLDGEVQSTDAINLSLRLATYYYIEPDIVQSGQAIVEQGQIQQEFIAQIQQAKRFEDLILDGVEVGKEDLMAEASTISATLR